MQKLLNSLRSTKLDETSIEKFNALLVETYNQLSADILSHDAKVASAKVTVEEILPVMEIKLGQLSISLDDMVKLRQIDKRISNDESAKYVLTTLEAALTTQLEKKNRDIYEQVVKSDFKIPLEKEVLQDPGMMLANLTKLLTLISVNHPDNHHIRNLLDMLDDSFTDVNLVIENLSRYIHKFYYRLENLLSKSFFDDVDVMARLSVDLEERNLQRLFSEVSLEAAESDNIKILFPESKRADKFHSEREKYFNFVVKNFPTIFHLQLLDRVQADASIIEMVSKRDPVLAKIYCTQLINLACKTHSNKDINAIFRNTSRVKKELAQNDDLHEATLKNQPKVELHLDLNLAKKVVEKEAQDLAKNFVDYLIEKILADDWSVKLGGKKISYQNQAGHTLQKTVPTHVALIYEQCCQASKEKEFVSHINKIGKIGSAASKKPPFFTFFGLAKRAEKTSAFYKSLEEAFPKQIRR